MTPTDLPAPSAEATPAIAFMRTFLTPAPESAERAIRLYARRKGYEVVKVMSFDRTALDPTLRLITAMHTHGAQAVLVPSLAHISSTRRAITEQWKLVAVETDRVWPRGHRWPRPRAE